MGRVDDAVKVADLAASMAKTPDEQTAALALLANAQQYRDYQKQAKERQEAAEKARALCRHPARPQTGPTVRTPGSLPPHTVVLTKHSPRPELLPNRSVIEGTVKGSKCSGLSTLELALNSSTGRASAL